MATKKKVTKKVAKKDSGIVGKLYAVPVENEVVAKSILGTRYNKYGVCLDCNGGNPDCTHNNLVEDGGKVSCAMCGLSVS